MIENPETAKCVLQLFLSINDQINKSISVVENKISPAEFKVYKNGIGYVMYEILERIMEPICKRHLALKPPEMDS